MKLENGQILRIFTILCAFLIIFIFFYVRPVLWNSDKEMKFIMSVPKLSQVGDDFRQFRDFTQSWLNNTSRQFSKNNVYPPLFTIFIVPFSLTSFLSSYAAFTLILIALYTFMTLILPLLNPNPKKNFTIPPVIFVLGLFSYPFIFALERGQTDIMAMFFCFLSIFLFHKNKSMRSRLLSFVLFSIAVQIKVYPAIFALALIETPRNLWPNIKRILILGLSNFALFFSLGLKRFNHFFETVVLFSEKPYIWEGNSSIKSFFSIVAFNAAKKLSVFSPKLSAFLTENISFMIVSTAIIMFLGLTWILYLMYQNNVDGNNKYLIAVCTLISCTLPALSNDYRLAILGFPIALILMSSFDYLAKTKRYLTEAALFIIAICYFSTHYFWFFKDHNWFFKINFPSLFTIFMAVIFLSILNRKNLHN